MSPKRWMRTLTFSILAAAAVLSLALPSRAQDLKPVTVWQAMPDFTLPAFQGGDMSIAKLKGKYADALGVSALSIHQADVKGETIYRVRVSGLSKADAGALCSKLKAGGGDCFIAKD